MKTKIVSSHTADSKPVKQEVNGTVILPPLVFPALVFEPRIIRVFGESITQRGRGERQGHPQLRGDAHGGALLWNERCR